MSQQRIGGIALAGAAVIGAGIYASRHRDERNSARQKRDMGLSGAGIGRTGTAGGTERGERSAGHTDQQVTTAKNRDALPSGGSGGGPGAGGSSARAVEMTNSNSKFTRDSGQEGRGNNVPERITNASTPSGVVDGVKKAATGEGTKSPEQRVEEGTQESRGTGANKR